MAQIPSLPPSGIFTDAITGFRRICETINTLIQQPTALKSYAVANVPLAGMNTGSLIFVPNESGGAVPAFSDGMNWRRCTDRAIIS
jgi:hypothetical protein